MHLNMHKNKIFNIKEYTESDIQDISAATKEL